MTHEVTDRRMGISCEYDRGFAAKAVLAIAGFFVGIMLMPLFPFIAAAWATERTIDE